MVFQALDDKGRHFMELLDDNLKPVEPSTTNSSPCYDLKSLGWDSKTTLVLSNTRELDRVPNTK